MKTNKTFAYGLFAVILALSLAGCPDPEPTHTHDYSTAWKSDATQHWHECSCGDKTDVANHTGDPCDICGYASGSQNPDICECNGIAEDCECEDCDCEICEEEIVISSYTVTFDADNGTAATTQTVTQGGKAEKPADPAKNGYSFTYWFNTATNTEWDFNTPISANINLKAKWILDPFTTLDALMAYLAEEQEMGIDIEYPLYLPIAIDLGDMTQTSSGWQTLLACIETAGKYVSLDLSACDMDETEFNPIHTLDTGKDKIVSLILPNEVTDIVAGTSTYDEDYNRIYQSFNNFSNLKIVSGANVTKIGNMAFMYCTSLKEVNFLAVTNIGNNAFRNCTNLTELNFPIVTDIGSGAFSGCTVLTKLSFPATTNIGNSAFSGCNSLSTFNVIGNGSWSAIEGGGLVLNNTELFAYPTASGNITLNTVTTIGSDVFSGNENLIGVDSPSVTSIGSSAFNGCTNLVDVNFPLVNSIGAGAFMDCTNLALSTLPAGITSIGDQVFYNCTNLALTALPAGITYIGSRAFINCTSIALTEFPAELVSISYGAFWNCQNLEQIVLPSSLTSIGDTAFAYCTKLVLVICLAETPPTIQRTSYLPFENTHTSLVIKVPATSIEDYKSAQHWSSYANRIEAIE